MSIDFSAMTVIELRKMAKEMGVKLGAGVNKADIVDKLTLAEKARESVAGTADSAEAQPETEQFSMELPLLRAEPAQEQEPARQEEARPARSEEGNQSGFRAA